MLIIIAVFLGLLLRCFYLQHFKYNYYYEKSLVYQRLRVFQKPQRGPILDRRGRILAASNKTQTIFADSKIIKNPKIVAGQLAEILDMPGHEICKLIVDSENSRYVKIRTDAEANLCDAVKKIYGIGVESEWKRECPAGAMAAHVVGFTSSDNRGLEGIERLYDGQLSGLPGKQTFMGDVSRRPIRFDSKEIIREDGFGLILTIDAAIQKFTYDELKKQYLEFEAESAIAIAADPDTGEILSMVSLPEFDPENRRQDDFDSFRNRALTDPFEPGSMIKPIVTAIALDANVIDVNETIFCENGDYGGSGSGFGRINEYRDHRFGNLKIREIIIKSSNIGMAKIGQKCGKEILHKGMTLFGFGRKTNIDLPGEDTGLLRPTDKWTGYSVTRIPYGYEVSVTATQMLKAFCILANGGHAISPYIVKAVVDKEGDIKEIKRPTPPIGFIVKPEVAKWIVTNPLVGVVNERKNGGTGYRAKLEKWQVFGKTGTANITLAGRRGYAERANIASFVAGAPAENPRIVVIVSIRRPNSRLGKGDSGGVVAAPVAGRIIEKSLNYLEKTQP